MSALKDLQAKIKKLEEEREFYKQSLNVEKQAFAEYRLKTENSFSSDKIKIMTEKEEMLKEQQELATSASRFSERIKALEAENALLKQVVSTTDVEKRSHVEKATSYEKYSKECDDKILAQQTRIHELESLQSSLQVCLVFDNLFCSEQGGGSFTFPCKRTKAQGKDWKWTNHIGQCPERDDHIAHPSHGKECTT